MPGAATVLGLFTNLNLLDLRDYHLYLYVKKLRLSEEGIPIRPPSQKVAQLEERSPGRGKAQPFAVQWAQVVVEGEYGVVMA